MGSQELGQPSLQEDDFSEEVISQILKRGVDSPRGNLQNELDVVTHIVHVVVQGEATDTPSQPKLATVVKSCKVCKDAVGEHYIVKKHSYVDTATQPYMCGICREAFEQGYLLKIHLEVEHGFVEQDSNRRSQRIKSRNSNNSQRSSTGSSKEKSFLVRRARQPTQARDQQNQGTVAGGPSVGEDEKKKLSPSEGLKFVDLDTIQEEDIKLKGSNNKSHPAPDSTILLTSQGTESVMENGGGGSIGDGDREDAETKTEQYKNGDLIVINLFTEGGTRSSRKKSNCKDLQNGQEVDNNRYKCDFCNLSFPSRQKRGIHIKKDHPDAMFCCELCGDQFPERKLLTLHQKIHKKERLPPRPKKEKRVGPPVCTLCDKTFVHESGLKIHTQFFHPELVKGEKKFCCEKCGSMFWTKAAMVEHQRIHLDKKPFVCSYCKKGFCRKSDLKSHTKVHTGEKPFACTQCEKTFRQRLQMVSHMRVHTGERPYKCDVCDKAFAKRDQLTRHLRVHTEERPYKCSQCGKSFKTGSNLKDHERLHTGAKPFKCSQCEKAFAQYTNLVHHTRIHTGLKPYACPQCEKTFSRSNSLKAHLLTHRNGKKAKSRSASAKNNKQVLPTQQAAGVEQVYVQGQIPVGQPSGMTNSVVIDASEILASMQNATIQFEVVSAEPVVSQQALEVVSTDPVASQQGLEANICPTVGNFMTAGAGSNTILSGQIGNGQTIGSLLGSGTAIPGFGPMDSQGVSHCESIAVVLSNMSDFHSIQSTQNNGLGGFQ